MAFEPQRASRHRRVYASLPPPCGFIATAMDLAMVSSTQWDDELIADLASERPVLSEAQMMGI